MQNSSSSPGKITSTKVHKYAEITSTKVHKYTEEKRVQSSWHAAPARRVAAITSTKVHKYTEEKRVHAALRHVSTADVPAAHLAFVPPPTCFTALLLYCFPLVWHRRQHIWPLCHHYVLYCFTALLLYCFAIAVAQTALQLKLLYQALLHYCSGGTQALLVQKYIY